MKTKLLVIMLLPTMAFAQNLGADVDAELDQLYSGQQQSTQGTSQSTMVNPATVSSATQPIYILNQATPNQSQGQAMLSQNTVQKQPTTIIEASPLTESRADMMRKARQEAEGATETRIVEKLEQSRMEDERKRAAVLFGDKFGQLGEQQNPMNPQPQAPVQAPVVAPAPAPIQVQIVPAPAAAAVEDKEEKEDTRTIVREEIRSAMETEADAPVEPLEQKYFGASVGIGQYPDVTNVTGNYALGFAFGSKFDDAYAVEGSFNYSNYSLELPIYNYYGSKTYQDVNQYAGALTMKYFFFNGMVKPIVGGTIQYSYREYADSNRNQGQTSGNYGNITSHAVDLGAIFGADIQLGQKTSLGVDLRYMINMSNSKNYPTGMVRTPGKDLESLAYYVMGVTAKINF